MGLLESAVSEVTIEVTRDEEKGPHVSAGVICESILQEADGTVSIIRIVDRVVQNVAPGHPVVPASVPLTLAIMLTSGDCRGAWRLSIQALLPGGLSPPILDRTHF